MTAKKSTVRFLMTGALVLSVTGAVRAQMFESPAAPLDSIMRFGPVDPVFGYPIWAEDANGTILELCLDTGTQPDPMAPGFGCPTCIDPLLDLPDATMPLSFPDNFTEEAFYYSVSALMPTVDGLASIRLDLEAAFDGLGTVQDGEQIVFNRLRSRIDGATGGATYKITHPYGAVHITADGAGARGINITNDVFLWKGQDLANPLRANFGTFLQASDQPGGTPIAFGDFLGDFCVDNFITGSPFGTNVFRIEGPNIGSPGAANLCADATLGLPPDPMGLSTTDCIETYEFALLGKLATNFGAGIERATYKRDTQATQIDVWAMSQNAASLVVSGPTVPPTPMTSDGQGNFYAHVVQSNSVPPPAFVTVTNTTDTPPTTSQAPVVDAVRGQQALFDLASNTLTVQASSSRTDVGLALTSSLGNGSPGVALDATGMSTVTGLFVPPTTVSVSSAFGGSMDIPVDVVAALPMAIAAAGTDQIVSLNTPIVTLNGTGSTGATTYSWVEVDATGTPLAVPNVTLNNANTATPSFTFPSTSIVLDFQLSVTDVLGGTNTDTVMVTDPIIPSATSDATPGAVTGGLTVVGLDASGTTGVIDTFAWTQTAGPAATLDDPNIINPSFVFPLDGGTVTFEVLCAGPAGTGVASVSVTGTPGRPFANAGPDQTVLLTEPVQLFGGDSLGVISNWTWTQVSGDPVALGTVLPSGGIDVLAGTNIPNPGFIFNTQVAQTLVFRLSVDGPGGSTATDLDSPANTVAITAADPFTPDTITIDKAQYNSGKGDWKIEGLSSTPGPGNTVTIYLEGPFVASNAIGSGVVDAAGKFKVQSPQDSPHDPTLAGAPTVLTAVSTEGGIGEGSFQIK